MRWTCFACALSTALGGDELRGQGWQRLDGTVPIAVVDEVEEPPGARLRAAGGTLTRTLGRTSLVLEATNGSPGAIRTLVASPAGSTWVAAANGLFVTHPDVSTLDRVEFGADGPQGEVVGLVADRIDRLWLATPTQVFAVHTGLWFHCAHTADDGLPPPPYRHLQAGANGSLVLHAASGTFAYHPDPARPRLVRAEVQAVADHTAQLDVAGEGTGRISFRYRLASHHLLRPIPGGPIDLRRPGHHALSIHAFDRELDASEPRALTVDVPFPRQLDLRLVASIVAIAGVLLSVWLVLRARRAGRPLRRGLLDGALALVVLLQLAMAMTSIGRTYPFIGFTMYGEVYRDADVLFTPAIVGRSASGQRELHGGLLAFATDGVWRHLTTLLHADRAVRNAFLARLDAASASVELRIRRCRLTANGPREVAPWVLDRFAREGPR